VVKGSCYRSVPATSFKDAMISYVLNANSGRYADGLSHSPSLGYTTISMDGSKNFPTWVCDLGRSSKLNGMLVICSFQKHINLLNVTVGCCRD